jgi:16S rRNA C967 or C1407 C5-methylase (RsmB/RsmF family)
MLQEKQQQQTKSSSSSGSSRCSNSSSSSTASRKISHGGTVTGVDVSLPRLQIARSLIRKYSVMGVRLYRADGCTFALGPSDQPVYHNRIIQVEARAAAAAGAGAAATVPEGIAAAATPSSGEPMPPNKKKRKLSRNAKRKQLPVASRACYDRVLVDAPCTHDGSFKHLAKQQQQQQQQQSASTEGTTSGSSNLSEYVAQHMSPAALAELQTLQRRLLRNAFALTRRGGGTLVYSTCSLLDAQNEAIVQWLLDCEPTARLVPIVLPRGILTPFDDVDIATASSSSCTSSCKLPCQCMWRPRPGGTALRGKLPHTLRFDHERSGTSGLFIAKFVRL